MSPGPVPGPDQGGRFLKLAVSGKGGVGKTTFAALLARTLAEKGHPVIAIDADPDANLASALGLKPSEWPEPISGMRAMIRERTGAEDGYGQYFKLNPEVADIPDKYSRSIGGVKALVLGGVKSGGSGCICPESALLRALVTHLLLKPGEIVILDMEAGIEHLGRGTAQAVSMMVVVAEPGHMSIKTARTVQRLASEIRIPRTGVVISKVPQELDLRPLVSMLGETPLLGTLSLDPEIAKADLEGRSPYTGRDPQKKEIEAILDSIAARTGWKG